MVTMTTENEPGQPAPRQMTCVRRLYVLRDEEEGTWLAAEEATAPGHAARGGAMSHRPDSPAGGAMSHLGPGDTTEVEGGDADQVTVLVPATDGGLPHRLQAYRVSPALLPSGRDPAVPAGG